eukprot:scaffold85374_cov66-Phaeocystis_antarctica.AAC.3
MKIVKKPRRCSEWSNSKCLLGATAVVLNCRLLPESVQLRTLARHRDSVGALRLLRTARRAYTSRVPNREPRRGAGGQHEGQRERRHKQHDLSLSELADLMAAATARLISERDTCRVPRNWRNFSRALGERILQLEAW